MRGQASLKFWLGRTILNEAKEELVLRVIPRVGCRAVSRESPPVLQVRERCAPLAPVLSAFPTFFRSLPQARAEMRKMTPMIASKAGCAAPPDRPITLPKPRRDFAALCACLNAFLGFLAAVGRRRQNQQDSPTLSLLRQSIARASAHHLSHFLQLAFLVIAILRNSSCR